MEVATYKYPRTFHLPWSPGLSNDDKLIESLDQFVGREVVVTEKMDGENTTLYPNGHTHARSMDSVVKAYRTWVKSMWSQRCYLLDSDLRVCGEDLFAQHSIPYTNLGSYFRGFSIWNGDSILDWDETLTWFEILDIVPVKTIYRGIWDEKLIRNLDPSQWAEGYVVRRTDSFLMDEFKTHVAKYVRKNHVQTDDRWDEGEIIKNGL